MPAAPRLRLLYSRLWVRLFAFNLLLVFLPTAGFFFLDIYERQLLDEQERAMVQQGRLLAAALAERGEVRDAEAVQVLERLDRQLTSRLRVLDADGRLLADSSQLGPRAAEDDEPEEAVARQQFLYRVGSWIYGGLSRLAGRPEPSTTPTEFYDPGQPFAGPEVVAALEGRYGATTRLSPGQRSITLYSALPIHGDDGVEGVVLVSQSTLRILEHLYDVRLAGFKVILLSIVVAVVLSLILATTIVRPVRRLRNQAHEILDRRGRLTGRFEATDKRDEIGDLARSLAELSRQLEARVGVLDAFAADVSHELRNPLASIRTAVEMTAEAQDEEQRHRFVELAVRETTRLEGLLSEMRELGVVDAQLEDEERTNVPLALLLGNVAEGVRLRGADNLEIELDVRSEVEVDGAPDRLAQVFENLLDNAVGFSPPGGTVSMVVDREGPTAVVTVDDEGPGVPAEHRHRVFDRFFSYRPSSEDEPRRHSGLGLAIVRSIVEGYGGEIEAAEAPGGGARFVVRLPLAS